MMTVIAAPAALIQHGMSRPSPLGKFGFSIPDAWITVRDNSGAAAPRHCPIDGGSFNQRFLLIVAVNTTML